MHDQSPPPHDYRWWRWAPPLGLLAAAMLLCGVGAFWTADEDYDGVTSMLNPVFLGTCCGAVVLVIAAPVVWWTTRNSDRQR
ncbi:hypothetical protein [Dactylosporangium sp. NPDC051484]|uniref:hypothetical protein n=1 Tax=Dactylosporangium sp. NPDC051484 TaxID=3154942 RepID=UPI003450DB86